MAAPGRKEEKVATSVAVLGLALLLAIAVIDRLAR
jgi:hypothetical protein